MRLKAIRCLHETQLIGEAANESEVANRLTNVRTSLELIKEVLGTSSDSGLVYFALVALKYVAVHEHEDTLSKLFEAELAPLLVGLLDNPQSRVQKQAFAVLEHMSSGHLEDVQRLVRQVPKLLGPLRGVLQFSDKRSRLISAMRTVCNLCACDKDTIQQLIDARMFAVLPQLCMSTSLVQVEDLAALSLCYAISCSTTQQLLALLNSETVPILCEALTRKDHTALLLEVLETLYMLLTYEGLTAAEFLRVLQLVKDADGWLAVDALAEHHCEEVGAAARALDLKALYKAVGGVVGDGCK